tara:strand:+ start:529 stop:1446 length:918 start_codon:yes stop_codon:yes gene_type:complete
MSFTTPKSYTPHYGLNQNVTLAFDASQAPSPTLDDYFPQWTFCFKTLIHPQNIFVESHHVDNTTDYMEEREPDKFRFVLNSVIPNVDATINESITDISQVIDYVPFLLTGSTLDKVSGGYDAGKYDYPGHFTVGLGSYLYRFIATACTSPGFSDVSDTLEFNTFTHPLHGTGLQPKVISGQSGRNQTNYEVYATHTTGALTAPGTMTSNGVEYTITGFKLVPVILDNDDAFVSTLPWITAEDVRNSGVFNQKFSGVSPASEVQGNSRIASIAITQKDLYTSGSDQTCDLRLQGFSTYTVAGNRAV